MEQAALPPIQLLNVLLVNATILLGFYATNLTSFLHFNFDSRIPQLTTRFNLTVYIANVIGTEAHI